MDIQGKTVSWFGNIRDKLDSFRSDIDGIINQVPFQYAENHLFTAGANVKQFCSEFMEEMLPDSVVNSLKQKTLGELLEEDANVGPTKGLSDDSSPFTIEMIEDANTDSSLGTKANVQKELCFEETRFRVTTFPFKVLHVKAHYQDGEYDSHDDLIHSSSSSTPAKEREVSNPNNIPSTDLKVELSTVHPPSSSLLAKESEASDLSDTEIANQEKEISDLKKELSSVSQEIPNLEDQFLENEVSSSGNKVEFLTVQGPSSSLPAEDGEVSDPIVGCNKNQFLENQVSSLDHEVSKESIDLNDRSDGNKAEKSEANHVAEADTDVIQSFRTVMSEDKFIMLDSSKLYLAPDLPEENHTPQGNLCKLCLTMKFEKECECERETSSKDDDAKSDQFGGKSVAPDQDFCESDWVIV